MFLQWIPVVHISSSGLCFLQRYRIDAIASPEKRLNTATTN
jgi:hypothetical protein